MENDSIAYAHAGKAVAYFEFDRRIRKIDSQLGGPLAYEGRRRKRGKPTAIVERRDKEDYIALFAGYLAQDRFDGSSIDYENLFNDGPFGDEARTAYLRLQYIRARKLIYQERTWEAIQAIAEELLKKGELSGQDAYWIWYNIRHRNGGLDGLFS
jgi:hypothetical protein